MRLSFPKLDDTLLNFAKAAKNGAKGLELLKTAGKGLGSVISAHPFNSAVIGIMALIAAVKIADAIIDKVNDNTEELLEKKDEISNNISDINGQIEEVGNQIAELNKQKLNITDSSDISVLNTQIKLLEQRKNLLEWKAKNEQKENETNADNIIESTKNNSTYSGASYMDFASGKLSTGKKFFFTHAGQNAPATYSAEDYIDSLDSRLLYIHPDFLKNVIYNLNEIYDTYDKIVQDDTLIGTESYNVAIEKQKQINELLQKTQYLQGVRNNLDDDYIKSNKLGSGWYVKYNEALSSVLKNAYSNNGIVTIDDVKAQFAGNISQLEAGLEKQGKTLEDYVIWLNAASASQVKLIKSVDGSAISFKSYSQTLEEYKATLDNIKSSNIDLGETQFGNIDTNNRQILEWNELNLSKYQDALMSWNTGKEWNDVAKEFKDSISTVYGVSAEYGGINIAFSPILQTESGAELLTEDTVNKYLNQIVKNAGDDKSLANILKLDSAGIEIDGKKISGLIADIGDTAEKTAEQMHFLGTNGALGLVKSDLDQIIDAMHTVDISAEITNLKNLNAAIKESRDETGLSSESLAVLKTRFENLREYNSNILFEKTSAGIKINREELSRLEKEQEKIAKSNFETKLSALKEKYKLLTQEMDFYSDKNSVAYLALVQQRNATVGEINSVSELAAQYEGLTSKYKKWIDAQSNGENGDMYDTIFEGAENAQKLIDKGLIGTDEFKAYVDLLSGKDLSTASVDEIVAAYNELGETIEGTTYKSTDFLTDSEIGCENVLNALSQLNSEWANEEDGIWNLNIPIDEAAEKLGISVEFLEAVLGKIHDYGITVNYEAKFDIEKIDDLDEVAKKAASELKSKNLTDIEFNFEVTNVDDVDAQIDSIKATIDDLKDDNGKLNLDSTDVKNAEVVLFLLLRKKAELSKPAIMKVDILQPTNDAEKTILKMQELNSAISEFNSLNELNKLGFDVDTTDAENKIKSITEELSNLSDEDWEKLGIDIDDTKIKDAINNINNTNIGVNAHLNSDDISNILTQITNITSEKIVEFGVDATKVEGYQNSNPTASGMVTFLVDKIKSNKNVWKWKVPTRKGKVIYEPEIKNAGGSNKGKSNSSGTGGSFAIGTLGAKKTETSLMGEVAPEIWVHSDTGKWELVTYPQFRKVKKGDIVFSGSQTQELLNLGSVSTFGTAFFGGTAYSGNVTGKGKFYNNSNSSTRLTQGDISSSKNSISTTSSNDENEKDPKVFDWIEITINRVKNTIESMSNTANNMFEKLATRISATNSEIGKIVEEIELQQRAADRYFVEANKVGLSSELARKVRDGAIDINEYDEKTQELIDDYQKWYEKSESCKNAITDLHKELATLYEDVFDNVKKDFENQISILEHTRNGYQHELDVIEEMSHLGGEKYYKLLQSYEREHIEVLEKELSGLQKSFDNAMASGEIKKYSEAWYDAKTEINSVKEAIADANVELIKYANSLRSTNWERFDFAEERISQLIQEADFLIGLFDEEGLTDDKGQFTDKGWSVAGLHAQNYDVYMLQADDYAKEILRVNKELAKDPANTELIERREELLKLQQDSIKSAADEKSAIIDLVKNGIEKELSSLKKLIDTYNESLDSAKNLHDYQKNVAEKATEIANIQKQMAAYANDSSEEAKSKIQKLEVSLKDAQEDLQETEYDRYISEQKQLLDDLYTEYEETINSRLDEVDGLLSEIFSAVNSNADTIASTIRETAAAVGYTLTASMAQVWNGQEKDVISKYGQDLSEKLTTLNTVVADIFALAYDKGDANRDGSITVNDARFALRVAQGLEKADAKTLRIADLNGDGKITREEAELILKKATGMKAYASGGLADYTGIAKVDGSKQKPELVLNPNDTLNFLSLRDYLRRISAKPVSIENGLDIQHDLITPIMNEMTDVSRIIRDISIPSAMNSMGDINIQIDHVQDYNDFITQLQHDPKAERMIQAMTLGQATGKGSLSKYGVSWK